MDGSVGVGAGAVAVAKGRKCGRRLFTVVDRATVGSDVGVVAVKGRKEKRVGFYERGPAAGLWGVVTSESQLGKRSGSLSCGRLKSQNRGGGGLCLG